jgi:hypothetical protein
VAQRGRVPRPTQRVVLPTGPAARGQGQALPQWVGYVHQSEMHVPTAAIKRSFSVAHVSAKPPPVTTPALRQHKCTMSKIRSELLPTVTHNSRTGHLSAGFSCMTGGSEGSMPCPSAVFPTRPQPYDQLQATVGTERARGKASYQVADVRPTMTHCQHLPIGLWAWWTCIIFITVSCHWTPHR